MIDYGSMGEKPPVVVSMRIDCIDLYSINVSQKNKKFLENLINLSESDQYLLQKTISELNQDQSSLLLFDVPSQLTSNLLSVQIAS